MSRPTIVIPARAGSKGWPRKNLKLFDHTAQIIPDEHRKSVIVTTDDPGIAGMVETYGFKVHERDPSLAQDDSDIRSVLKDVVKQHKVGTTQTVIMLYLTYPQRTWDDVTCMYTNFVSTKARSMLCAQPVRTHPCLTMFVDKDMTGRQVIPHEYYQRQQYPDCFELSHYMCMFRARELNKLNKNMYNEQTKYYRIDRVVDVDSEQDYKNYIKTYEHKDQG